MRIQEQDVIREFLVESHENLSRLDEELIELEKRPNNAALLASLTFAIHVLGRRFLRPKEAETVLFQG